MHNHKSSGVVGLGTLHQPCFVWAPLACLTLSRGRPCVDPLCEPCSVERTTAKHSWNGNWLLTNSVTFRLQRHSDHHAHASRPYQVRRAWVVVCASR